ncbi:hypothetical protein [Planctomycetes bacterium Pan216]
MRVLSWFFVPVVMMGLVGCGSSAGPESSESTSLASLKQHLKLHAETGEGGSGLEEIRAPLEELKESDPALYEELAPLYEKLNKANGVAQVKKIAGEMLAKVDQAPAPAP